MQTRNVETPAAQASSSFRMTKWYMDCVTEEGEVAILYCADLGWRGVHAKFSSVLASDGDVIGTRSSMARYGLDVSGDRVLVEFPRLKVSGCWEAEGATPVEHTVYENAAGSVVWNCLQPRSKARVRIGERELRGLGYAECLTLTLPPWQLPMRQLRWGRFVSPEDAVAWIDWQGPYSMSFATHNGRQSKLLSVTETEVELSDAILRMEPGLSLRAGRVGSTILPGAPALGRLLPHSLFNIEEQKWRSRGSLRAGEHESHGWVIHEVVHWKV